jgi:hypothetical protein
VQAPVAPVVTMSVLLEALEVLLLCARIDSPINFMAKSKFLRIKNQIRIRLEKIHFRALTTPERVAQRRRLIAAAKCAIRENAHQTVHWL